MKHNRNINQLNRQSRSGKVALICMPFIDLRRPQLGISLLKAALTRDGVASDIYYFNMRFAKKIGVPLYNWIWTRSRKIPSQLFGE